MESPRLRVTQALDLQFSWTFPDPAMRWGSLQAPVSSQGRSISNWLFLIDEVLHFQNMSNSKFVLLLLPHQASDFLGEDFFFSFSQCHTLTYWEAPAHTRCFARSTSYHFLPSWPFPTLLPILSACLISKHPFSFNSDLPLGKFLDTSPIFRVGRQMAAPPKPHQSNDYLALGLNHICDTMFPWIPV